MFLNKVASDWAGTIYQMTIAAILPLQFITSERFIWVSLMSVLLQYFMYNIITCNLPNKVVLLTYYPLKVIYYLYHADQRVFATRYTLWWYRPCLTGSWSKRCHAIGVYQNLNKQAQLNVFGFLYLCSWWNTHTQILYGLAIYQASYAIVIIMIIMPQYQ